MKPVAWMWKDEWGYETICSVKPFENATPLYTAPRELSDEEIENIAYKVFEMGDGKEALFNFARAILKKASEK